MTTRLSSVITGCGGNETTCSRRSISGRSRSTNGTTIVRPGVERARVAAEPLDHAGARLRDDPDRPREHDEHERPRRRAMTMRRDHSELLLFVDERGRALDLGHLDLRARLEDLSVHRTRAPTTPRRRSSRGRRRASTRSSTTRRARRRARPCRCGSRPACADATARSAAARRATRSSRRTKTTSCAIDAARRARRRRRRRDAASATGPRKNSPGVKISPTASTTATSVQRSQSGHGADPRTPGRRRRHGRHACSPGPPQPGGSAPYSATARRRSPAP